MIAMMIMKMMIMRMKMMVMMNGGGES